MLAPGKGVSVRGRQIPYTVNGLSVAEHTLLRTPSRYEARINHKSDTILAALNELPMVKIGMSPEEGIRRLAWDGIPESMRAAVWKLLCAYDPPSHARREQEHQRKIREYTDFVSRYFDTKSMNVPQEKEIIHQLELDLPRHKLDWYHIEEFCKPLERTLYIWSLRHPAVGYVQGMDDIMSTFFMAFLVDLLCQLGKAKKDHQGLKNNLLSSFSWGGSSNCHRTASDSSIAFQRTDSTGEGAFGGEWTVASPIKKPSIANISLSSTVLTFTEMTKPQDHLFLIRNPMRLVCTSTPSFAISQSDKQRQIKAEAQRNGDNDVNGKGADNTTDAQHPSPRRIVSPLESLLEKNGGPITTEMLHILEADLYWCGGKMLSWIQDHFVHGLNGVHNLGLKVEKLLNIVDYPYSSALAQEGLSIQQATFQWHHCLLARELSPSLCMRLWDTYLSIGETFVEFHIYVCCSIILEMKRAIVVVEDDNFVGIHHHAPPPTVLGLGASRDTKPSSVSTSSNNAHSDPSRYPSSPADVKVGLDVIIQLFRTPLIACVTERSSDRQEGDIKDDQNAADAQMEWLEGAIAQAYLIMLRYPPTLYS
eukprot:Tbor_TRINITY_DN3570_c0_g1::TRINITY_DN3570_c0_g1_i1::g.2873::m.2873/K20360/TBC1D22, GYP1; TBC1 domain family member 2